MNGVGVLVTAKAPVAGVAKTRLAATIGAPPAAEMAAAALLDTLAAVRAARMPCVVAVSGDLADAHRGPEVQRALAGCHLLRQHGQSFGARLAAAHHDASAVLGGGAVLQVGMDTPQLAADHLRAGADALSRHDAALGLAEDGGWWAVGLRSAALASGLERVPMSRPDTGRQTLAMFAEAHASVALLHVLRDVDTIDDAFDVAGHPTCGPHFRASLRAVMEPA